MFKVPLYPPCPVSYPPRPVLPAKPVYQFPKIGPSHLVCWNGTSKPNQEWLIEWLMMVCVWFQKVGKSWKTPQHGWRHNHPRGPSRRVWEATTTPLRDVKNASTPLWKWGGMVLSEPLAFSDSYDVSNEFDSEHSNRMRVMCLECIIKSEKSDCLRIHGEVTHHYL